MAPPQKGAQVALRNVTPSIPEGGVERAQLEEDLKKMQCEGLLKRPWGSSTRRSSGSYWNRSGPTSLM